MDQSRVNIGICLDNNKDNFQLHRFTINENIVKSFGSGYFADLHCTCMYPQ